MLCQRSCNVTITSITNPLNNTIDYQYLDDYSKCMTRQVLPEGNIPYTQTYEDAYDCRATSQTDADGNTTAITVQEAPTPDTTTETRPDGTDVVYAHALYGKSSPVSWEDARGNKANFTVNGNDQMTAITDRLGDTTSMTYHAASGFLSSFTNAAGNTLSHTYSAQSQSFTNPSNSHVVSFTFYNRTRTDYPDSTFETFVYDGTGNLTTNIDRNGQATTYTYNS